MNKAALNFLHIREGAAFMFACHFEACFRVMHFYVETVCTYLLLSEGEEGKKIVELKNRERRGGECWLCIFFL